MRNWTFWDWVGFSCLWVAALSVAADSAIKNSTELSKVMPQFFVGPVWPFVPLAFVLLATVVLLARGFGFLGNGRENSIQIPQREQEVLKSTQKNERIFVGASITPGYLVGFFRDHTGIQAQKLSEAYIGKWMKVTGGFAQLTFQRVAKETPTWVDYIVIYMYFRGTWIDRVAILKRGDEIAVIGEIEEVNAVHIKLQNCEIVQN
jgi:hypothetical protein